MLGYYIICAVKSCPKIKHLPQPGRARKEYPETLRDSRKGQGRMRKEGNLVFTQSRGLSPIYIREDLAKDI
jgi:hypothetical protein